MNENIPNHRLLRKYIVAFGNIFNDITIQRLDENGVEDQRFNVPITYAPKEDYVNRLLSDPDLNRKISVVLPRMSYEMIGLSYDAERKLITTGKTVGPTADPNKGNYVYNPVPYNLHFRLYMYVRNIEDGNQIVERILPFFTPENTIKLNLIPELNIVKEIPVVLGNVDFNIDYEGEGDTIQTRMIIWTLDFTMKGYIYGPMITKPIIKTSIVNFLREVSIHDADLITFNVANTGVGYFKTGEIIYQGYSLDAAEGTAYVTHYSNLSNELTVSNIYGDFKTNTVIVGTQSNAEYLLTSFNVANNKQMTITVTVKPNTATSNSDYTYVTTVTSDF